MRDPRTLDGGSNFISNRGYIIKVTWILDMGDKKTIMKPDGFMMVLWAPGTVAPLLYAKVTWILNME